MYYLCAEILIFMYFTLPFLTKHVYVHHSKEKLKCTLHQTIIIININLNNRLQCNIEYGN